MNPPPDIKQIFIDSYSPKPANDKLRLVVETTSSCKKTGIYMAYSSDKIHTPMIVDWGDGTVERLYGEIS